MGLLDWLWRSPARPEPAVDVRHAQSVEQHERLLADLRQREVPCDRGENEIHMAVIVPTCSDEHSLWKLGMLLQVWTEKSEGVKQILGLHRLLEGRRPQVFAELLMLPYCPAKPETCIEHVALVTVDPSSNQEELAASLRDLTEHSGAARVWSLGEYSYMNR